MKHQYYSVVFDNEHFIVCDKAANVLSVPSRLGKDDERPCLGHLLEKDLKIQIYPVHRLDFEVQGLILYAKTVIASKAGNAWFENKSIQKIYSAISKSSDNDAQEFSINQKIKWECVLERGKKRAFEAAHGKKSLTHAWLKSIDENGFFHWELEPVTGRSHQLRYELFRHHHPIVGDQLYGSNEIWKEQGIALKSFKIDFKNVVNRQKFLLPETIEVNSL